MDYLSCFKRYEIKYLLSRDQYRAVTDAISGRVKPDEYGKSTICNIYYDTPDKRLIRRSLEDPVYKEKLRLRSYGIPSDSGRVFLEIKKKYDSVVYKRREAMTLRDALRFIDAPVPFSQISSEIAYFIGYYSPLSPSVFLSYSREAFFGTTDPDLRITFDSDILWRDRDVRFDAGIGGSPILQNWEVLMEVKIAGAMPLWLAGVMSDAGIRKTSFSKYGRAYMSILERSRREKLNYA